MTVLNAKLVNFSVNSGARGTMDLSCTYVGRTMEDETSGGGNTEGGDASQLP